VYTACIFDGRRRRDDDNWKILHTLYKMDKNINLLFVSGTGASIHSDFYSKGQSLRGSDWA
jgi:hypothetical protein